MRLKKNNKRGEIDKGKKKQRQGKTLPLFYYGLVNITTPHPKHFCWGKCYCTPW